MKDCPEFLSDGTHTYKRVRRETQLGDGRANVALYEREPQDDRYQFTPCLDWLLGLVKIPLMLKLER